MPRTETPFRALLAGSALAVAAVVAYRAWTAAPSPLVVAVLAPETGHEDLLAAARLAARELGERGDFRGRTVEVVPLAHDGTVPGAVAAVERCLLEGEAIAVVAACSSAVREALGPIVRRSGVPILSVEPTVALGETQRVFDLAGTPSQRIAPAVAWALGAFGPRLALVRSPEPLERVAATLASDQIEASGGDPIDCGMLAHAADGEACERVVDAIVAERPDGILLALDAAGTEAMASALRRRGIDGAAIPTLHLTLTLSGLRSIDARALVGDYLMSPSLAASASGARADFARRLRGVERIERISEAAELAHGAVRLAVIAATRADPADRPAIGAALAGSSVNGASAPIILDPITSTAWLRCVIARVEERGGLTEVWMDDRPTRPLRWPVWRTREEWVEIARGGTPRVMGSGSDEGKRSP